MNRRQVLLGATTLIGGGGTLYQHRDKIPKIPIPELEERGSGAAAENKAEIMRWRYNKWNADEYDPNDYDATASVKVKNTSDKTLDFKVKMTPVHKNGSSLNTKVVEYTIKSLEYMTFEDTWYDDSTKYVNRLRVAVLVSDQNWFNGWEVERSAEYEF